MRLNLRTTRQIDSPISDTYGLLDLRDGSGHLLDLAQAAPQYPPAPEVVEHAAAVAHDPVGATYVPLGGLPRLRKAFAAELSAAYAGDVRADQVLVTAGCNQAFCVATSALAAPGDEVVLTLPYYFNHDMWLRLDGLTPVYLDHGPDLLPSPAEAEALLTARTRAIVLVTPGNPSGVTIPPRRIRAFADLARQRGIALVLDETYRSFRGSDVPAHDLFADADWSDTLISLHSFSKDLAIPGYRVGAMIGSPALLREAMKLLDCVTICAPRIGQEAAWAGLTRAHAWRAARAREVDDRRRLFSAAMADRPGGFELLAAGGFFGWIRHPFDTSTCDVVRSLVVDHDVLVIAGTAFEPIDRRTLRVSFANVGADGIGELARRLTVAGSRLQ